MLEGLRSVISFLSIIPAGDAGISTAARHMYVFPIAGAIIGLISGGLGFGLFEAGADPLIAGLLAIVATAIITGLHHTDGLADFADGLMVRGSKKRRLEVMKDTSVGTAGVAAVSLYFVGAVAAMSLTDGLGILIAILLAEIIAKFSMVLMASVGDSAAPGSALPFISNTDGKRLALAAAITIVPVITLGGVAGTIMLCIGVIVSLLLTRLALKSFGGVTGDVLGAANEMSRLAAILVFVSI